MVLLNQAGTPDLQAAGSGLANELLGSYQAVVIASLGQELIHAVHEPVAAIILAAGASTRFGSPKQVQEYHGQPFVRIIAQTALAAGLSPVVVVTGAESDKVESALIDLPVRICRNKGWSAGQSSSIRAGLARIDEVRCPLRMDRSTWLRKAVARNLQYATEHELPVVAHPEIQSALMPECL